MAEQGYWDNLIFSSDSHSFQDAALEIFRFQAGNNSVYRSFIDALGVSPEKVTGLCQVPFLPVRFFKSHKVVTGEFEPITCFESSGTTATINSHHYIKDLVLYERSFTDCFRLFYGEMKDWCIIGLLPSYLERQHSSLVYMVDKLIKNSGHPQSGFYLDQFDDLATVLGQLERQAQKTLLIGVTFALLDFAEKHPQSLRHTIVMETGGMKGRGPEIIRAEVHQRIKSAFGMNSIHSEYGMTELLSQAYSRGSGIFSCPPWMKILVRDDEDPFSVKQAGAGIINVIDLANIYSCSFIATDDMGRLNADGTFEVSGRVDGSDLRGCSLMGL